MSKKILIIEDEQDIRDLVAHYLTKEGYKIEPAPDGAKGLGLARTLNLDLIILDLMLPEMDGLEVCKKLRADPKTAIVPIIMLTAKGEETDKIVGLELGADDYLTKPFSPKELTARVKALLRRTAPSNAKAQTHIYGDLHLDAVKHEVRVKGKEVPLTAKEFGLLEQLLQNEGRVLTRDVLLNQVWGYDYYGTTRTVDVHIRRLREKIPLLSRAILTVKPYGYKLKEEG
jgi:two-component system, OmpR family, alkaline phosphatase synthesis response regulator PhoP